jgi:hypothetical protein
VTVEVWIRLPEMAVTLTVYVPRAAKVVVGVVPPEPLELELLPPQPEVEIAATERSKASRAPQRRRRGRTRSIMQAKEAPEPAMYQGAVCDAGCEFCAMREVPLVELWEAVRTRLAVTGEPELTVMVAGLKV